MNVINYANKNQNMGCRVIWNFSVLDTENFSIGRTCVSNVLMNAKVLQGEWEFCKENWKKLRHGKGHLINEILIAWYKKCISTNVFPDGPVLKEEAMFIKERLNKDELAMFTTSNRWLEKFKQTYRLREMRITVKVENIPKMTIQSLIERLPELTSGYKLRNIWNMDKLVFLFKALLENGLVKKSRKSKGSKSLNNFVQQRSLICSSQWFKNFRNLCNLE